MSSLSPRAVLQELSAAIPTDCRNNIIVVGSLAAGYHYFARNPEWLVQTKDVDCMISPHVTAVPTGKAVAERLIAEGWEPRPGDKWTIAGDASTPETELPLVRLHPPTTKEWNVELLNAPAPHDVGRHLTRLRTRHGDFALCSFRYLALAEVDPLETEFGIALARPEMMALANLLHHPAIGKETMSGAVAGRKIKRANKDLGRVLALAVLAQRESSEALLHWPDAWVAALKKQFPDEWRILAGRAGSGIRALLASEEDVEEARHCVANSLLAGFRTTNESLRATALRLVQDATDPLARLAAE